MDSHEERLIPGKSPEITVMEHLSRYLFAKKFTSGKVVLDIGCGSGYGDALLARESRRIYGLDNSEEAIFYAKKNYGDKRTFFIVGDACSVPFKDSSFDTIICFEVIEHILDHDGLIKEVYRLLKDEGEFLISTPEKSYTSKIIQNPYHIKELYYKEFKHLLQKYFAHVEICSQGIVMGALIKRWSGKKRFIDEISFIEYTKMPLSLEVNSEWLELPYLLAICIKQKIKRQVLFKTNCLFLEKTGSLIKTIEEKDVRYKRDTQVLQEVIRQKEEGYRREIETLQKVIQEKDVQYEKDTSLLKELIQKKDTSYRQRTEILQKTIEEKDAQYERDTQALQEVIRQKEEGYGREIEILQKVIQEKDAQYKRDTQVLQEVIRQKEEGYRREIETLQGIIQEKDAQYARDTKYLKEIIQEKDNIIEYLKEYEKTGRISSQET
jgi:ubiquinone/menaquinone biosynthesis C-methylase UbiE/uncharacterized protein YneR